MGRRRRRADEDPNGADAPGPDPDGADAPDLIRWADAPGLDPDGADAPDLDPAGGMSSCTIMAARRSAGQQELPAVNGQPGPLPLRRPDGSRESQRARTRRRHRRSDGVDGPDAASPSRRKGLAHSALERNRSAGASPICTAIDVAGPFTVRSSTR